MGRRRPLSDWMLGKIINYGNSGGGFGWIIYWILCLFVIVLNDVIVLRSTGSIIFFGYIFLTAIYLIVTGLRGKYKQYLEETEP